MVTLQDVAEYAGVSISTVSRVMANKEIVSPATKKKVIEAARYLNYQPNALAKSLKLGRSYTISLMIPSIQNQIFPDIVRGVEDTAQELGYTVILCNTDEDDLIEEQYINKMKTSWVDGFLVASMRNNSYHFSQLHSDGVPVVLINRYIDNEIDAVIIDNYQAAYEGTNYLINLGHKKIAFVKGRNNINIYNLRFQGYKQALKDSGIQFNEKLIIERQSSDEDYFTLVKDLVTEQGIPDAFFVSSDPKALRVMRALHDMEIEIPDQVSVLGFDNIENSGLVEPPLSTISQPLYNIGMVAASKLIEQIEYKDKNGVLANPKIDILPTQIVERKSTKQNKKKTYKRKSD